MRTRSISVVMAGMALGLWAAGHAGAQPAGADGGALEEFRAVWEVGRSWAPPEGWVFRWRKEFMPALTLQEIESREAEMRDLPNAPGRAYLRFQRRMLESGPASTEFEAWWSAPGSLRLNSSYGTEAALPYTDVVATPETVFCLTARHLVMLDPDVPAPMTHQYAESAEGEIVQTLHELLVGGLGAFRYGEVAIAEASFEGADLVGVVSSAEGASSGPRWSLRLERDESGRRWFVREALVRTEEVGQPTQSRVIYGEQVPSGVPGASVASRVEFMDASGRALLRYTWLGARPMEAGEFARVTRVPSIDSVDAVRGPVTFTSMTDYRSGVIGRVDPLTRDLVTARMPGAGVAVAPRWLMVAGWTSAAILIASLVGVRLWRSRRASQRSLGGVA